MKNTQTGAGVKNYRLPTNVRPERYVLMLAPDLVNLTFTGEETIELNVLESTDKVVLNSVELAISKATISRADGTTFDGTVSYDTDTQMATISVGGKLGPGKWNLFLAFTGKIRDDLKGLYLSTIKDPAGNERRIATTQFESTDARSAFPCFDEPEFKASFKITLVVDAHHKALSNGRLIKETPVDNGMRTLCATDAVAKKAVEFTETMKMSTYLVCCIAGEFASLDPIYSNGKELRIWAPAGHEHLTKFARKVAAYGVAWYEKYFRVPYAGGDKIDFVAIPDFDAGAMENLGCITFRMTDCLIDEDTATHAELKRVAEVVLHELAHMWFGDLVTMKWWVSLWLNESFATFMENKSQDQMEPTWGIWDEFGLGRAAAMRVDALKSTHAIESPVNRPEDAQELFDVISYEKGCSVLRMIEQFIGEEVFRDGITAYLKKHAYSNAQTSDLWDSLEQACTAHGLNIPVRRIMDAWVLTPGHPVVSVSQGVSGDSVVLSQQEFKFLAEAADSKKLFPVPVIIRAKTAGGMVEVKHLLDGPSAEVYIGKDVEYVVVNAGGSGLYRVRYAPELIVKLTANVQERLSVIERFNLVNDTWSCVRAGLTSATDYLGMVKLFGGETDPNVWSIIRGSIATLFALLPQGCKPAAAELIRGLLRPAFERIGWTPADDESVQIGELRGSLISSLGTIGGDTEVRSKVQELFAAWKADRTSVDADIVPAMVSVLAYTGDAALYDEFVQLWKTAKTPQEGERFVMALAEFRNAELLQRTLAYTINGEVKNQDAPFLLFDCFGNEAAPRAAWDFMLANWDKLVDFYSTSGMVKLVGAVRLLDTPELETDVKAFFATHIVESGTMAIAQALEQLRINVSLRERESAKLTAYINPPAPPAPAEGSSDASGK